MECIERAVVTISSLAGSRCITVSLQMNEDNDIFVANKVTIYGIEYNSKAVFGNRHR